ncbi:hypothetical protein B9Z19DRAFT_1120161 [Tuber borchii]|uniref:Uncharacterized protein n=1 Tax=Tuber borchii TaxID=42251 RepID=A0A2T7A533_TUBBO|nr:hypothetical protein B9Z19DRAFT_1120161 [Tuber borchii]
MVAQAVGRCVFGIATAATVTAGSPSHEVMVDARRNEHCLTDEPYHSRQLFPLGLIFTDVPKTDPDGYSWVPESFTDKNANYAGLLRAYPTFPDSSPPVAKDWESHYQITHVHVLVVEVAGPP